MISEMPVVLHLNFFKYCISLNSNYINYFFFKLDLGPNPIMTTISDIVTKKGARFVCYFPNWSIYRAGDF